MGRSKGLLNKMGRGMHPLNYASKLVKTASDVMFSISVNDSISTEARLAEIEKIIKSLREQIPKGG